MARIKTKVEKFNVSLSEPQSLALRGMMEEDMQTEKSNYMGLLIMWEARRRKEQREARRPGRPRKDSEQSSSADEENEPRNIPHPDQIMNRGRLLTLSEYEAYNEIHGKGPQG